MAPEQTAPLRVRMEAGRVGGEKQNLSLEGKTRERLKCLPLVGNDHYGQGRERKMLTRGGPLMEAATVSERWSQPTSLPSHVMETACTETTADQLTGITMSLVGRIWSQMKTGFPLNGLP